MANARFASSGGPEARGVTNAGAQLGSGPNNADRRLLTAESFLNNALLESGHAIRYDGGAKEE